MNWIKACVIVIVLTVSLSSARAQSASANFDLVSADWSAKQAKTLNALPKSAIWNFVSGPFRDDSPAHVCDFRFADLRHLGTLSLVAVIDVSGRGFCSSMEIFDRTDKAASGFVESSSPADLLGDLRDAIQDIGHDGNLELVLDGSLAESETHELDCFPEWPVIVAWTGSNYTDVSSQYKGYYERYLSSLNSQLAAKSSDNGSAATPASVSTPEVAPASPSLEVGASDASFGGGFGASFGGGFGASAAQSPASIHETAPRRNPACVRISAAKTEQFLGIRSEATMSAAIKDSESNDPSKRILASVLFSFIGTPEAMSDLKTLAEDPDREVAKLAKQRLSGKPDPDVIYEFEAEPVPERFLPKH